MKRWFALTLLAALACNPAAPEGTDTEEPVGETDTEAQEADADCDLLGFPCTPAEVDPAAQQAADDLLRQALDQLAEGDTIASIASSLREDPDVLLVTEAELSLTIYRTGALPVGLVNTAPYKPDEPVPEEFDDAPVAFVVGHGTPRDNPAHEKKALVLSPWDFEYKVPDAGHIVSAQLRAIPDYSGSKGGVTFLRDDDADITKFLGWDAYDVVLYNGHSGYENATQVATGRKVKTSFLTSGTLVPDCSSFGGAVSARAGLGCNCLADAWLRGEDDEIEVKPICALSVHASFFKKEYPNGLDKALVYLNSCFSYPSDTFTSLVAGSGSVFFGWSNWVRATSAFRVTTEVFKSLAKGVDSKRAHDLACLSGCKDGEPNFAELKRKQQDPTDDLRIREATEIRSPVRRARMVAATVPLADGQTLPLLGSPGDGEDDDVLVAIAVRGVEEGEESEHVVRMSVDGEETGSWGLDDRDRVTRLDDTEVVLRVPVPLGFDAAQGQSVTLRATTDLPDSEGGESWFEVTATLASPLLRFYSTITSDPQEVAASSGTVSAEVYLALKEQDPGSEVLEVDESEGRLEYVEFSGPDGTQVVLRDGTLTVAEADWQLGGPSESLPTTLTLLPAGVQETVQLPVIGGLPLNLWLSGFISLHSGHGGLEDERVLPDGFAIGSWSPGSGDVLATRAYDRAVTDQGVEVSEVTMLELVLPEW